MCTGLQPALQPNSVTREFSSLVWAGHKAELLGRKDMADASEGIFDDGKPEEVRALCCAHAQVEEARGFSCWRA
jgi:hypothetical protein